jgi:hypothetical protein
MTTDPNVETPTPDGAAGNQPGVSQEQGKSIAAGSQEFLELKRIIETQGRELKGLQSRQDKEKNEVQRFMDEVKGNMAKGMTLEQAENAVNESRKVDEEKQLLRRIAQKLGLDDSSPTQNAGNGATVTNDTEVVLSQYQLSANDPEVITKLNLQGSEFKAAIADLAYRRATKQPPSAAESATIVGSAATGRINVDALNSELQQLVKTPSKPGSMKRITEIKKQLNDAGG